jgi:hypothetical protein
VRPYTQSELTAKLTQFGPTKYFWTDANKSHCFVQYESVDVAKKVHDALNGVTWPTTGRSLVVTYTTLTSAKEVIAKEEYASAAKAMTGGADDNVKRTTVEPSVTYRPWTDAEVEARK